jgi:hypothetical protein
VILFFDYNILYNRTYYIAMMHSAEPDELVKWNKGKDYKLKYPQYYKNTKKVLFKLYKNTISKLPNGRAFQVFQQVAIKNKTNLNKLVEI